jgi:hypothetical protein
MSPMAHNTKLRDENKDLKREKAELVFWLDVAIKMGELYDGTSGGIGIRLENNFIEAKRTLAKYEEPK